MFKKLCIGVMLTFMVSLAPQGSYQVNAALFKEFSVSDEKKLAKEFEVLVKSRLPIIEDPEIKFYVRSVVEKILKKVPPQPFSFETNVIYSPVLNAFATPGGYVCVFTGLLINLEDEDSLAGILSHEVAHVTQRHIASRIDRSKYISIGTIAAVVGAALAGGGEGSGAILTGGMAASQAAMLSYGREDESDADKFGLQYMLKAGYNPNGMAKAFKVLQTKSLGVGSDFPTYLSTHPNINARIATSDAYIRTLSKNIQNKKTDNRKFLRAKAVTVAYYADPRFAENYFAKKKDFLDYVGLGVIAAKRNQIKQAEEFLLKAVSLAPQDTLANRELGRFYFGIGKFNLAKQYLEKTLALNAKEYMAIFYYARTLDAENNTFAAQKEYEKVLKYAPEDGEVLNLYGRVLGRQGKEFEGYIQLALAEIYQNNEDKALFWLKKVQEMAKTEQQKKELKKVNSILSERQKYWK